MVRQNPGGDRLRRDTLAKPALSNWSETSGSRAQRLIRPPHASSRCPCLRRVATQWCLVVGSDDANH